MTEAEIRADERRACAAVLGELADEYVNNWGPTLGWDDAKADAWNIKVASMRMLDRRKAADPPSAPTARTQE
jgi:hypothetical protein